MSAHFSEVVMYKEYITGKLCVGCGTKLIFRCRKRIKYGYSGNFVCESCMVMDRDENITDEYIKKNVWFLIL